MKVLNAIKKFFLGVLTLVFFAYAIVMTFLLLNFNNYGVTEVGDTSIVIIKDKIVYHEIAFVRELQQNLYDNFNNS